MGHDDSMMTLFELLTSIPVGITQQATDKNANIVSTNISYISQRREPSPKFENSLALFFVQILFRGLIPKSGCTGIKLSGHYQAMIQSWTIRARVIFTQRSVMVAGWVPRSLKGVLKRFHEDTYLG